MQTIRTRVFEIARARGFETDQALAESMGISAPSLYRVKVGQIRPSHNFISGALRAFPDLTFDDLFYVESDATESREPAEVAR